MIFRSALTVRRLRRASIGIGIGIGIGSSSGRAGAAAGGDSRRRCRHARAPHIPSRFHYLVAGRFEGINDRVLVLGQDAELLAGAHAKEWSLALLHTDPVRVEHFLEEFRRKIGAVAAEAGAGEDEVRV